MKKIFYIFLTGALFTVVFSTCKEEDYSTKEYYKNVIYLLSKENYNVYNQPCAFDDGNRVIGYLSIGCGGSRPNGEEFTVELEPDTILFDKYNTGNFDIDTAKFAKLLPENRYLLEKYKVTFPANNPDQYVKLKIRINPDSLSPDSIYFIPLAIKNVSNSYEINEKKFNVLFRIAVENYFAEQLADTYYRLMGVINPLDETNRITVAASKMVRPLSKNSVRVFAGSTVQTSKSTVDSIKKHSIVVTVDPPKDMDFVKNRAKVTIKPYAMGKTGYRIELDTILTAAEGWNIYEEFPQSAISNKMTKEFKLHYRYRTAKTVADGKVTQWNNWIEIQEILTRLE